MRKCGKNTVEWGRTQMKIWRMRIVCWTHSGCIILVSIVFLLQQWLQERASLLRYTYSDCLV